MSLKEKIIQIKFADVKNCLPVIIFIVLLIAVYFVIANFTREQNKKSSNIFNEIKNIFSGSKIVGSCQTPGDALGIYVSGNYAYMADEGSGLQTIDISKIINS